MEWKDAGGNNITLMDCIRACQLGAALMTKEIQFNKKLTPKLARDYERKKFILERIKTAWEQAGYKQQKKKEPRLITPSKR